MGDDLYPAQYPKRTAFPRLNKDQVESIDRFLSFQPEVVRKWVNIRANQYQQMGVRTPLLSAKMDYCEWRFKTLQGFYETLLAFKDAIAYFNESDKKLCQI